MKSIVGNLFFGMCFTCLACLFLPGCTPPPADPIDRLVKELSADDMFPSGLSSPIYLPAKASPKQVALIALNGMALNPSQVKAELDQLETNVVVLEIKPVVIYKPQDGPPPEDRKYTAVLVDTKPAQKIILMQYQAFAPDPEWWAEVFDAK
jgi:hypothetical protein